MTNWKQFLTEEVLKECWHGFEDILCFSSSVKCQSCGIRNTSLSRRAFNNRNDMMDLYEAVKKDGRKWEEYLVFLWPIYLDESKHLLNSNAKTSRGAFVSWLFCLDCADYEDRFKMVAEFY
jgi:hypothetical protein